MAHRSTFVRHEVDGLFSVCGIKYTTAQRFARRTIERVFGPAHSLNQRRPEIGDRASLIDPQAVMSLSDEDLRRLADEESVTKVEDFVERRMDWILDETERTRFEARLAAIRGIHSANALGEMAMSK
jgi:glycerol-3-phosphate dehydrogenase